MIIQTDISRAAGGLIFNERIKLVGGSLDRLGDINQC